MTQDATRPGLQKQTFRLNMGQGLEQKTDAKTLSSGKMLVLQNAKFTVANRLSKRDGFAAVGAPEGGTHSISRLSSANGAVIGWGEVQPGTTSRSVYTYGGNYNSGAGQYEPSTLALNDCLVTHTPVIASMTGLSPGDFAATSKYSVYAYLSFAGVVGINMYDRTSGNLLAATSVVSSTGIIRCLAVGNNLMMGYVDGSNNLNVLSLTLAINSGIQTQIAATTTSFTGLTPGGIWDWSAHSTSVTGTSDRAFLAYQHAGKQINVYTLSVNGSVLLSATVNSSITISGMAGIQGGALCAVSPVPSTVSTTFRVAWTDTNLQINYVPLSAALVAGAITKSATVSATTMQIIGQELTTGGSQLFIETNSANPTALGAAVTPFAINSSSTFAAAGTSVLGQSIQSKVMYRNDLDLYFWSYAPSAIQGQYIMLHNAAFVGAASLTPAARVLGGVAIGGGSSGSVGSANGGVAPAVNVSSLTTNYFESATLFISNQAAAGGQLVQFPGIGHLLSDFTTTNAYNAVTLNNQFIIPGGFNAIYDNGTVSELGFFLFPEATVSVTTTGGTLAIGTYQSIFTYEWTDQNGYIHRSETSVPVTFTTTTSTSAAVFTVPNLRVTAKPAGSVNVVMYSTATVNASPAVFYWNGQKTSLPTINSVTFAASLANSASNFIYTQGGIEDNFTIDGTSVICAGPDRLLAADPSNTGLLRIGKGFTPTVGLSFFSGITSLLPTAFGPMTAILYMDTSYIIFYARAIFAIQGQGPTDNGQGNGLTQPQKITDDLGCDGPNAATLYPDGIMFKSAKGYYRLGRDLSFAPDTNYIGAGVESFNSFSCLRALCRKDINQCRFLLSDNATILVYDYLFKQWSTIQTSANDMTVVGGSFYLANATPSHGALVGLETLGTFTDAMTASTGIPFLITTGWCALNQLQGCQRIYRVRFLGDFRSTHTLQVEFAYDFEGGDSPTFNETHTITSANIGVPYQCEAFPLRQKCQAIAIRISDPAATGESFDLTDIELVVGVIPGRRFPLSTTKGF